MLERLAKAKKKNCDPVNFSRLSPPSCVALQAHSPHCFPLPFPNRFMYLGSANYRLC
jgi:hypothetical protein